MSEIAIYHYPLAFKSPRWRGSSGTISIKLSTDGQGRPIKRPRKIVENFNRLSGVHERYRWGGALLPHTIPGFTGAKEAIASPRQTAAGQKNHVDRLIKNRFYQSYRMHQNLPFELSNRKILWGLLLVSRRHPIPHNTPSALIRYLISWWVIVS